MKQSLIILFIFLFIVFFYLNIYSIRLSNSIQDYDSSSIELDVVYTWVDGNDLHWKDKKNKYTPNDFTIQKENSNQRYQNIQELKYSIRSIYYNMPWIHHIYIVVDDDQIPSFINLSHPKITIVPHSTIFPSNEYLPTFNSHSIESCLHRIPNLKKYFMYMNDDFFIGRPIYPSHLFHNNLPYFFLQHVSIQNKLDKLSWNKNYHQVAYENTNRFLNSILSNRKYNRQWHLPVVLNRDICYLLEYKYPYVFHTNRKYKFRHKKQYHIIALINLYMVELGYKIPCPELPNKIVQFNNTTFTNEYITNTFHSFFTKQIAIRSLKQILYDKPYFYCLNDVPTQYKEHVIDFFNSMYPYPCEFEVS